MPATTTADYAALAKQLTFGTPGYAIVAAALKPLRFTFAEYRGTFSAQSRVDETEYHATPGEDGANGVPVEHVSHGVWQMRETLLVLDALTPEAYAAALVAFIRSA